MIPTLGLLDSFKFLAVCNLLLAIFLTLYCRRIVALNWLIPVLLLVGTQIIQRIDQFGLGYVFYRITSDVEKLPMIDARAATTSPQQSRPSICCSIVMPCSRAACSRTTTACRY